MKIQGPKRKYLQRTVNFSFQMMPDFKFLP